jgi:catechol-2,3-dioxygenase
MLEKKNKLNESDIGIVQIYLPASDLLESIEWYISIFGFHVISQNEHFATLGHSIGPIIMLRRTEWINPVLFMLDEREFPVLSIMFTDIEDLHQILSVNNKFIGNLKRFGDKDKYIHFHIKDPYGNLLDIGNYPDRR